MSITDELRHNIEGAEQLYGCECKHLLAIADRIDMEHERLMVERADRYSELRAKMNNCYIELPKDADGEYIHIGDEMETTNFGTVEVEGFVHRAVAFYNYSEQPAYLCTTPANLCRHYHAPTVEDVLLEACKAYHGLMIEGISDFAHDMPAPSEIIAKYAAKLRLAEKRETYE